MLQLEAFSDLRSKRDCFVLLLCSWHLHDILDRLRVKLSKSDKVPYDESFVVWMSLKKVVALDRKTGQLA